MDSVAIIFVGTRHFMSFYEDYYNTIKELFLPKTEKHFFTFTDDCHDIFKNDDITYCRIDHMVYPYNTLFRFKYIDGLKDRIKDYDYLCYIDADMKAYRTITEEEFFCHGKPYHGVQHPCFINKRGTYEKNPESLAYIDPIRTSIYWQGCFWGGKIPETLELSEELSNRIDKDLEKDILAIWFDESHLNAFYNEKLDKVHTYDSSFAYPEEWGYNTPKPKSFIHRKKDKSKFYTKG